MNCAWCSPSNNGTDGICDACMLRVFGVDPVSIHQEIADEQAKERELVSCPGRQRLSILSPDDTDMNGPKTPFWAITDHRPQAHLSEVVQ